MFPLIVILFINGQVHNMSFSYSIVHDEKELKTHLDVLRNREKGVPWWIVRQSDRVIMAQSKGFHFLGRELTAVEAA